MALNPLEKEFALSHYSVDEAVRISYATDASDSFESKYYFDYDHSYLGHLIRTDSEVAKAFQAAIGNLLPFSDNLLAKARLARLYALKYEYSSFQTAFEYAREGAEAGLAEAQLIYGRFILWQNDRAYDEALFWMKKAADRGHQVAMFYVGSTYSSMAYDSNTPIQESKKYKELSRKYLKDSGTLMSAYDLAVAEVVQNRDYAYAKKVCEAIVDRYPLANLGLGNLYCEQKSPYIDYPKAYKHLSECAKYGHLRSMEHLAWLYDSGKISGGESAEYWIRKAIEIRENRRKLLYERDRKYPKPPTMSSLCKPIYAKYGYREDGYAKSTGSSSDSDKPKSIWAKIFPWVFWISIAYLLVNFCS